MQGPEVITGASANLSMLFLFIPAFIAGLHLLFLSLLLSVRNSTGYLEPKPQSLKEPNTLVLIMNILSA